ncbi:hypothetical protein FK529_13100 [Tsukamurella asaccharolytica]|uniref:DUF3761 domain-containing protein n=1 Tax=Tsukamurella asaccharolytica TaxID=2592067 RepID=A0A5C5R923_9ACTN|nr:hypothetical protein [Tsukamurella asaccharolytica]TWS18914.1 hypothetical protein FK529_13100 [Tsukamurella asaccharolytica]
MSAPQPPTPPSTGPGVVAKVIGWLLIAVGVLMIISGIGSESPLTAVLLGGAMILIGAVLIWRFLSWKVAAPVAILGVIGGGVLAPDTAKEQPASLTTVSPSTSNVATTTTTSATSSTQPSSMTSSSSRSSTPTTTTTVATTTTTTLPPVRSVPTTTTQVAPPPRLYAPPTTTTEDQPAPAYTPPRATGGGNSGGGGSGSGSGAGSGGHTGAICKDGSTSTATGRGACSGHGGVARWLP